jgi:hypothetical protein
MWLLVGALIGMFLSLGSVYVSKPAVFILTICLNGTEETQTVIDYNDKLMGGIFLVIGLVAIPGVLVMPRFLRMQQMVIESGI